MKTSKTASWTRRIAVAALAAVLVSGGVYVLAGAQREYRAQNKALMRMKLAWADGVLEGLTLEKFDQVSRNALRLRDLTHSNLWYSMRQPEYKKLTYRFSFVFGTVVFKPLVFLNVITGQISTIIHDFVKYVTFRQGCIIGI